MAGSLNPFKRTHNSNNLTGLLNTINATVNVAFIFGILLVHLSKVII